LRPQCLRRCPATSPGHLHRGATATYAGAAAITDADAAATTAAACSTLCREKNLGALGRDHAAPAAHGHAPHAAHGHTNHGAHAGYARAKPPGRDHVRAEPGITLLTWNVNGLLNQGSELTLVNLLEATGADVATITETELPHMSATFSISGYTTFYPLAEGKVRAIILVRTTLATATNARLATDLMDRSVQSIWVRLDAHVAHGGGRAANLGALLVGGLYRQWRDGQESGLKMERDQLHILVGQLERATEDNKSVILMGDMNLNSARLGDPSYGRRGLLTEFVDATMAAGLEYLPTPPTWRSYGCHALADGTTGYRHSTLDHVYVAGVDATVKVLGDSASDHFPVLVTVRAGGKAQRNSAPEEIHRRNFKAIGRNDLESALQTTDWSNIYKIHDVDAVHRFLVDGIVEALDVVAPLKLIRVRKGADLYLAADTLAAIRDRNNARLEHAPRARYRALRNRATVLVLRDKRNSNQAKLTKSNNDPRVLWQLADAAMVKDRPSLPASLLVDGSMTATGVETATRLNEFYVTKIDKLREASGVSSDPVPAACPSSPAPSERPHTTQTARAAPFSFHFATAGRVAKVIKTLNNTEVLGVDGIPVSILKRGSEVLSGPLAHLINRSLADGVVPRGFKLGIVHPVFKGGGKCRKEPGSYRPISILPAMSKVLEIWVKTDL
jgi:endonuclease/exonuclease/phosphatase (EEP) superfamily protein YafD